MILGRSGSDEAIDRLQALTETLWVRTALGKCLTIDRARRDDGSPHVEVVKGRYDIVVTERGRELQRMAGLTMEEAARSFLFDMARAHASTAELASRTSPENAPPLPWGSVDDGYSRWNWMAPSIEIMARILPEHGDWAWQYYREVLDRAPLEEYERRNARYPLPDEWEADQSGST